MVKLFRYIAKRSLPIFLLAVTIPLLVFTTPIMKETNSIHIHILVYFLTGICSLALVTIAIFEYQLHHTTKALGRYADAYDDSAKYIMNHELIPSAFKHQFNEFNTKNIQKVITDLQTQAPTIFME